MRCGHSYKYMFHYKSYNCCNSVYSHGTYQQIGRHSRSSFLEGILPNPFRDPLDHKWGHLMPCRLIDLQLHSVAHSMCSQLVNEINRPTLLRGHQSILAATNGEYSFSRPKFQWKVDGVAGPYQTAERVGPIGCSKRDALLCGPILDEGGVIGPGNDGNQM
jgi:hypothetical protein